MKSTLALLTLVGESFDGRVVEVVTEVARTSAAETAFTPKGLSTRAAHDADFTACVKEGIREGLASLAVCYHDQVRTCHTRLIAEPSDVVLVHEPDPERMLSEAATAHTLVVPYQ